jgi:hypothetical protein
MFTRVVEMTSESRKSQELADTINGRAEPILKKQRGVMDEIVLVRLESRIAFWLELLEQARGCREYQGQRFQKIHDTVWHPLRPNPRFAPLTYTPQSLTKLPQARPPE